VLANRREDIFLNKEEQMVIEDRFNSKVRRNMRWQLVYYVLFLVSLTWMGILMTSRDSINAFMLNQGILAKVWRHEYALPVVIVRGIDPLRGWVRYAPLIEFQLSSNNFFDDTAGPAVQFPVDMKTFDTIDADYDDFYFWCHYLLPGNEDLRRVDCASICTCC